MKHEKTPIPASPVHLRVSMIAMPCVSQFLFLLEARLPPDSLPQCSCLMLDALSQPLLFLGVPLRTQRHWVHNLPPGTQPPSRCHPSLTLVPSYPSYLIAPVPHFLHRCPNSKPKATAPRECSEHLTIRPATLSHLMLGA